MKTNKNAHKEDLEPKRHCRVKGKIEDSLTEVSFCAGILVEFLGGLRSQTIDCSC